MLRILKNPLKVIALSVGAAFAATSSASALDTTSIVAEIDGAVTTVGTIGAAVIGVTVAIAVVRWIRSAV